MKNPALKSRRRFLPTSSLRCRGSLSLNKILRRRAVAETVGTQTFERQLADTEVTQVCFRGGLQSNSLSTDVFVSICYSSKMLRPGKSLKRCLLAISVSLFPDGTG